MSILCSIFFFIDSGLTNYISVVQVNCGENRRSCDLTYFGIFYSDHNLRLTFISIHIFSREKCHFIHKSILVLFPDDTMQW